MNAEFHCYDVSVKVAEGSMGLELQDSWVVERALGRFRNLDLWRTAYTQHGRALEFYLVLRAQGHSPGVVRLKRLLEEFLGASESPPGCFGYQVEAYGVAYPPERRFLFCAKDSNGA